MNGAREFAWMFCTGQVGRLYLVSGRHARGSTFQIYVLPEGDAAKQNGDCNGPLNANAVEVYGVIGGQRGWTESYGWLHKGKWQDDFAALVGARRAELDAAEKAGAAAKRKREDELAAKQSALLAAYEAAP